MRAATRRRSTTDPPVASPPGIAPLLPDDCRARGHRSAAGLLTQPKRTTYETQKLLALYGLKWNPFSPECPLEALYRAAQDRELLLAHRAGALREGGFALIHGDPGTGKSVVLRLLAERLARLPDLTVGVDHHPQSNLADFYRELGDIFCRLAPPHNRWGGFKTLRERWLAHLEPLAAPVC